MNCMIHHERAAVNTCKFCNGGLCPDCVAKKLTFENSMVCESCFIENGHNYIAELEQEQIKQKKDKTQPKHYIYYWFGIGNFYSSARHIKNRNR